MKKDTLTTIYDSMLINDYAYNVLYLAYCDKKFADKFIFCRYLSNTYLVDSKVLTFCKAYFHIDDIWEISLMLFDIIVAKFQNDQFDKT